MTLPRSLAELLYSFGCVGYQLRLGRSEAANISPWMIRVECQQPRGFEPAATRRWLGVRCREALSLPHHLLICANAFGSR